MITASAIVYADLIFLRVQNSGFFGDDWKMTSAGQMEQVYVNINNLQHVKNALATVPQTLQVAAIAKAVDGPSLSLSSASGMLDVPRYSFSSSSFYYRGTSYKTLFDRSPVAPRSRSGSFASNSNLLLSSSTAGNPAGPAGGGNNNNVSYDNSARQAFHGLLDTAREHYEAKLLRIAGCLADKVIRRRLFYRLRSTI